MRNIFSIIAMSLILAGEVCARDVTEVIEVVGQTPLGAGIDINSIASNVQSATAEDIREQRALDMADFLKRNLASVFVNEAQNNPLQPDVQYRGFVGSPLLGLPQGIAVYQDGVRVNEPFGDTVNWALIPDSATEAVYLMPGSNPLFGLNALGGAIAIKTKDGISSPGTSVEIYGGSFGRFGLQAETGGSAGERLSYFVTGTYMEEEGWRDYSPTEAVQLFGKLGWRPNAGTFDLGLTLADTDLIGNGATPIQLLASDRAAIFTRPDQTKNDLVLVNLTAEHELSSRVTLTGNVYLRSSDVGTYNGDDSDFSECENDPGFLCVEESDEETLILDQNYEAVPASEFVEGATIGRTNTEQDTLGISLQASWTGELYGQNNRFVFGFSYDDSDINYESSTELGRLDSTRLAIPSGVFVNQSFTHLNVSAGALGLYLTNTFDLSNSIALTLSGRYNGIDVRLQDQLGTALDGDHSFNRLNPAIGITIELTKRVALYAGYNESNRAPSPVELTCADTNDPCRLPNAFLADPPLEQVVAETYEAGLRGLLAGTTWHAGLFRTTNRDDILFISAGALTNEGFFDNVGQTRRDGLEFNLDGQAGDSVRWFINYTWLDATFRETLVLPSPNNPAAIDGEVSVRPGDQLPLIPRDLFKAGLQASFGDRITIGGDVLAGGNFHMRGDEGNDLARIGDYVLLNLRGDYRLNDNVRIFVNIDNVLDERYETFGLFGEAADVLGDDFVDKRFLSPAAPRGAWLGVRITF